MLYEFIEWGYVNHSALKDINRDSFFLYAISNMAIGGSGTWVAMNDQWEMHFNWTGNNYQDISKFLLRHMGGKVPTYYFLKDKVNVWFNEKNINEYHGLYSHSW